MTTDQYDLEASCAGKKAYPDHKLARAVARGVAEKRGVELRVYQCELCGMWHLTKQLRRGEHHV